MCFCSKSRDKLVMCLCSKSCTKRDVTWLGLWLRYSHKAVNLYKISSYLGASSLLVVHNVAWLHCCKSICQPKKFNLVHQTVSPRERVGSGDKFKTTADCACTLLQSSRYSLIPRLPHSRTRKPGNETRSYPIYKEKTGQTRLHGMSSHLQLVYFLTKKSLFNSCTSHTHMHASMQHTSQTGQLAQYVQAQNTISY